MAPQNIASSPAVRVSSPSTSNALHEKTKGPAVKQLPKAVFEVSDENDIFNYNSIDNKISRIAWLIFSIIIFPVGLARLIKKGINLIAVKKYLLPALGLDKAKLDSDRAKIMADPRFAERRERLAVKTADHVTLDSLMIKNPQQEVKEACNRKYILFLNGNSAYEEMFHTLTKISDETGANVFCGNFRGVGCSEGFPMEWQDLVMDGEAMVQYLLSKGVPAKNILIHGHSIGGSVGIHVAALHQETGNEISVCADRTSASISLPLKYIRMSGWNFNTLDCYETIKGHKFIIYHRHDQKISYPLSLYKKVKDSQMSLEDKKQKQDRKVEKIKTAQEKGNKVHEERAYRPKNALRLDDAIDKKLAHEIALEHTVQFEVYKALVATALA